MTQLIRTLLIHPSRTAATDIEEIATQLNGMVFLGAVSSPADAAVVMTATRPHLLLLDDNATNGSVLEQLHAISGTPLQVIHFQDWTPEVPDATSEQMLALRRNFVEKLKAAVASQRPETDGDTSTSSMPMPPQRLVLRTHRFLQVVTFDEIIYCNSQGGYTTFFLTNNRKVLTSRPLKDYEQALPHTLFIRTHQSYIVNHQYIDKLYATNQLLLKDGTQVPVAVRKKSELLRSLLT